ncbi:5'-nucleotidase [Paenibacillus validus]|uniref:5'-nucleotidase n=1 Tax=Paenibacillus validus TaxID=44253 RepID=UPI000FD795D0|nr:5'-nucleotidase [Paenibacillus validus]MED4601246.1 5'-nucleotidase [Paenibacillus validus]MED4607506.1 5'-nucleotidase [Paenibacillus validus]
MPYDLTNYLVIGVSSRALFELSEEDEIFQTQGLEAYSKYQIENEDKILKPGIAFSLIKSILHLNELVQGKRKTEVIIMSRNNADTSLRIFNSIEQYGLDISRAALTSGRSLAQYLKSFEVDLFLSADEKDVQAAIDAGVAAGLIYKTDTSYEDNSASEIRIAFDGDAVLFSEESEEIYQKQGLEAFLEHEKKNAEKPLPDGPFAKLLRTISFLQKQFGSDDNPIRTALVTARNSPAHKRVILTLRHWGIRIDEAFFLGGAPKEGVLKAFGAHIFFDDQDVHLKGSSRVVPSAKVPIRSKE